MNDPISDMLARIRNAAHAAHETVDIPYSKIKFEIARILKQEGYIDDYADVDEGTARHITVTLRYGTDRTKAISGLRRISKPGLRVYANSGKLPKVLGGMGTAIISTSGGLMTDREAARAKRGGEVIAYIW